MENGEVTLDQVLRFREKKAGILQVLQSVCGRGCVVSLGMNIPGPVKTGPSVYHAFLEGKRALEDIFRNGQTIVRFEGMMKDAAGYAAVYQIDGISAEALKLQAVELEETHFLGRLFDIDVSDGGGAWITRESVGGKTRKCLLCGRNAKVCGRSRTHTADELYERVSEIIDSWSIGTKAYAALMEEVYTTPKPGLVDRYSPGAHTDMDLCTFLKSAEALFPYFVRMAALGRQSEEKPEVLFRKLRETGILAEQAMMRATKGINTHKGAIFTLGILCGAAGRCIRDHGSVEQQALIDMELQMVRRTLIKEMEAIQKREAVTGGERNIVVYGITGIRGEAASGYPAVTETGIPVLRDGIQSGKEWNLVKLQILLSLMSRVEDSNIVTRHHPEILAEVQGKAEEFLKSGGAYAPGAIEDLIKMDREYTERNISAGGCADLLAASIFVYTITGGEPW